MRNTIIYKHTSKIDCCIDNVAPDKSISHRSIIFSFLSNKASRIRNYLFGEDTLNTLKIAIKLGLEVESSSLKDVANNTNPQELIVKPNKNGILEPDDVLDCGNAGTTIRLYTGLLAPAKGQFILSGDKYLRSRPMSRVIAPLKSIGANITARSSNGKVDELAPICIIGSKLKPFSYHSEISSAQVKTALLLTALQIDGQSNVSEIAKSRDHSERILLGMGANLTINNNNITINPPTSSLEPIDIEIPADPSSAFYFAVLSAISANSSITISNVLLNETRIEAFLVLQKMGANVTIIKKDSTYEDIGDICIKSASLKAVNVDSNISWLIDEIPALAIAFAVAEGSSKISNAKELRFKESDRIKATLEGLRAFGVECEEFDDGFIIKGGINPPSTLIEINSYGDHRIAMSFAILGVLYGVKVLDSDCIDVSFPNFLEILSSITKVENL